jgi:predicted Zn-dependent protease with MMP-like domain
MTRSEFEAHLECALDAIPVRFRGEIANLAFVIENSFDRDLESRPEFPDDDTEACRLLGLYEGVPRSEFSGDPTGMLPDKITLFQDVIEAEAEETGQDPAVIIRHTVWHEIAHFFGFDEEGAERLETKWEKRFRH